MKYTKDRVIILCRTNYGERDRIITVLGRNFGRVTLIAKSTRSAKSKLAGSIELLSEIDVEYVEGRGKMHTLTGARLHKNYSQIPIDIDCTMQAYDALKALNKIIQEGQGSEYYGILAGTFLALDNSQTDLDLIKAWFYTQVLKISGHLPSLSKDAKEGKLVEAEGYMYDFDAHCFTVDHSGKFTVKDIKLLRILAGSKTVPNLNSDNSAKQIAQLVEQLVKIQVY